MLDNTTFDYVIVGAGASGCVLANRLSASTATRVLLLEAGGPDAISTFADPGGFVELWGSDADWLINTEPQSGLGGRQILINQGKVVGGSTSLNAMMWVRGNRRNYDEWAARGNPGWSYEEVLPYFKKIEDYEGGASEFHGAGGPISVRDCPDRLARSEEFMAGATELGYDGPFWDTNGARQENGAGLLQFSITRDGRRASASQGYLDPIRSRPNLVVTLNAEVTRVLFQGTRVTGIEFVQQGQTRRVRVAREAILSAGAFQSPKLLMLSGIGPADYLRSLAIEPVVDLPGVGANLQDHLQLPVVYRSKIERPMTTALTGNVLFVRTREERKSASPDLQLNFSPSLPAPLSKMLNFGGPVVIFLPILVQPDSTGTVKLRSANPLDPPLVNPNYLQQAADARVLTRAVSLIRQLAQTSAFRDLNGGEIFPGEGAELESFARAQCSTLWHPAGTCQMGEGHDAVVDPELRVRGVDGLRVADASVMPRIPSGNTQAGCFMIGEKLADMILASQ